MKVFLKHPVDPRERLAIWSVETLREHVLSLIEANDTRYNQRFDASQSAVAAAFLAQQTAMSTALTAQQLSVDKALAAADRAVSKAETAAEKRFDSVTEFREVVSNQQHTLMPRSEAELLVRTLTEKCESLSKEIANLREARSDGEGRASGQHALWGYIIGVAGVAMALVFHFFK